MDGVADLDWPTSIYLMDGISIVRFEVFFSVLSFFPLRNGMHSSYRKYKS